MTPKSSAAAAALALLAVAFATGPVGAIEVKEPPYLQHAVIDDQLPPVAARLPRQPLVEPFDKPWQQVGQHGGDLYMLMRRAQDTRQMTAYSYARLVRYNLDFDLEPDILRDVEIEEGRIFTLHLRENHKWSDGALFTTEDFRYWWEDVAHNEQLSPIGAPAFMKAQGHYPDVAIIDETTIRYEWPVPNPDFLPALAGARPDHIYHPAHYLKQYHESYRDPEELAAIASAMGQRNWAALHTKLSRMYRNENPALPTLDPWIVRNEAPSDRFVFERNPYFHRIDPEGRQLPYLDRVIFNIIEDKLIPGKAATGDVDLQGRYLGFDDFTLLKRNETRYGYKTLLWRIAKGAHLALYPNMTHEDPMWRALFREPDFRRALSLAVNRYEINRVIYFGLAMEGQNTLLPGSPLYDPSYREAWATFDIDRANELLDGLGLERGGLDGMRRLPNGDRLEIIVETGGSSTEDTDVLQLVADTWREIGVKMYIKPMSLENVRRRVFAGLSHMTISSGLENGLASSDMAPSELAPVHQIQYQWSNWGQYQETNGNAGEPVDMEIGQRLMDLLDRWYRSRSSAERAEIWRTMLEIHRDNVFTIGLIAGVMQPIVVRDGLMNLPEDGVWNWDPGAHFGIYGLDKVWWDESQRTASR